MTELAQCFSEFVGQEPVISLHTARPANQDVIGSGDARGRQYLPGEGAEAALHAVADDRSADLLGNGDSEPH